jgi:hypothetical protein
LKGGAIAFSIDKKTDKHMSKQKRLIELFGRLQELGFTYNEAVSLRRIEMTLQRWGEKECGDGSNWAIERDETTGKPFNVWHGEGKPSRHPIADREAGALRRLEGIVINRNTRNENQVAYYHQSDPRGCALYLIKGEDITKPIDQIYYRGLAVCA